MNNDLAVADAELLDAWHELEDAIAGENPEHAFWCAARWWSAREQLRDVLLQDVAA